MLVVFNGAHEDFCQAHGKVEVIEFALFFLGADKLKNVGVIHAQDAHIGPAPRTALLHLLCGGVEDAQKGYRAGGNAPGGTHAAILGAQARKRKSRAAARLVDHGRVFDRIKNFFNGVAHRQHKAGRKLPQISARIHERGRIGQKLPAGHEVIEIARQHVALAGGLVVLGFLGGNARCHPPEKITRGFHLLAAQILAQIALLQNNFRIGFQLWLRQILGHCEHEKTASYLRYAAAGAAPKFPYD